MVSNCDSEILGCYAKKEHIQSDVEIDDINIKLNQSDFNSVFFFRDSRLSGCPLLVLHLWVLVCQHIQG